MDRPPPTNLLPDGTMFGAYQIVRSLGVGATAVVYEAIETNLQKRVALKLLHAHTMTRPTARARFEREARISAQLKHPHIVDVYDLGIHEEGAWIAMEYVEGESVQALLRRERRLPVSAVADIVIPVASALHAAHASGIVHRDVKPENILLARHITGALHPKLVDFGVAKVDEGGTELTSTTALLGSPCYMAPEQIRQARSVDGLADQWAVGVLLYEAAVGRRPFTGETLVDVMNAVLSGSYRAPRQWRPDIPDGFERVVTRALQIEPEQRFPSMNALAAALVPFASEAVRAQWGAFLARDAEPGDEVVEDMPTQLLDVSHTGSLPLQTLNTPASGTVSLAAGEVSAKRPQRAQATMALATVVLGALVGVSAWWLRAAGAPPRESHTAVATLQTPRAEAPHDTGWALSVTATPPNAAIEIDQVAVGTGTFSRHVPAAEASHQVRVSAAGHEPQTVWVTRQTPMPLAVTLRPLATNPGPAENTGAGAAATPALAEAPRATDEAEEGRGRRHRRHRSSGGSSRHRRAPGGNSSDGATWF